MAMVTREGDGERAAAHRHALAGRGQRARAHQPASADDEGLVEHDDAAEERRTGEAVAVEDAVERLLRREDLALRAAHRHADGVRGHASALPPGVPGRRRRSGPCVRLVPAAGSRSEEPLRGSGPRRALEALLEPLDLAGRVHDRLLAGVERVAVGADVDAQLGPRGADGEGRAAGSADDAAPGGTWGGCRASRMGLRVQALGAERGCGRSRRRPRRGCASCCDARARSGRGR